MTFEEILEAIASNDEDVTDFCWMELSDYTPGKQPTIAQLERLASALINNPYVTEVDLVDCSIGDAGAKIIAGIDNEIVTRVNLTNCGISAKGVEAFENNKTVTRLIVSDNPIGPEGAESAARNNTLQYFSAHNCQIGDRGARALWKNNNFIELSLYKNGITDAGLEGIENVDLDGLDLSFNEIKLVSEEVAQRLAKAKIEKLDLGGNQIEGPSAKLVNESESIGWLTISNNKVPPQEAEELKRKREMTTYNPPDYHQGKRRKVTFEREPYTTPQKRYLGI